MQTINQKQVKCCASSLAKADVISKIADKTGIDKGDVSASIEAFFSVVKGSIAEGQNIYVRGFGSFLKLIISKSITKRHLYIIACAQGGDG